MTDGRMASCAASRHAYGISLFFFLTVEECDEWEAMLYLDCGGACAAAIRDGASRSGGRRVLSW